MLAAGVVALGAAVNEATNHYEAYVEEVARGSKTTGIATGDMSGLKFAAEATGTSYDALVTGLTRFSSTIVKAAEGGEQQRKMFDQLGISQEQVKAGEKDMLPLLMTVADRFQGLGSQVERTAMARDLFSRGGADLVNLLAQGSEGIKRLTDRARGMGLVLSVDDVNAMREYKASLEAIKHEHEELDVVVGRQMLPLKTAWEEMQIAIVKTLVAEVSWKEALAGSAIPGMGMVLFLKEFAKNLEAVDKETQQLVRSMGRLGDQGLKHTGDKVKEAATDFRGFSGILSEIQTKTAQLGGDEAKLVDEVRRLQESLAKAGEEYRKLQSNGKLTSDAAKREMDAFVAAAGALSGFVQQAMEHIREKEAAAAQAMGEELRAKLLGQEEQTMAVRVALWDLEIAKLRERINKETVDKEQHLALLGQIEQAGWNKIGQESADGVQRQGEELDHLLAAQAERTLAQKHADFDREIEARAKAMLKEEDIEPAHWEKLDAIAKAGHAKIEADAKAAGDAEVARLGEQLARLEREHQTAAERIQTQYAADLAKYVAAEERKTLKLAMSEAQRAQIAAMFAAIRKGLTDKEQADLQQLANSQGWQGVFGAKFAEDIKRNEALLKEWATSAQQSHMMVRVSLESLKEMGQQTFEQFAQAEGAAIAQAMVYSKSIGAAMEAALKSTLESLSARALTQGIYSAALGFLCLAEQDYEGAGQAFAAAAIFGSVGAAAGVAGREIPGGAGGGSGAAAARAGAGGAGVGQRGSETSARSADQGGVGAPIAASGQHVTVNVYGHVVGTSGVGELCNMINDAVVNSDQPLTATNTKSGVRVTQ